MTTLHLLLAVLCAFAGAEPRRPVVGLLYTTEQAGALPGKDRLANYSKAIRANGGEVVDLSQLLPSTETAARLDSIDALLVPGGDDVAPVLYGETPHPKLEETDLPFDIYELAAVRKAAQRGIPVLGICKGHQLLNVGAGGTLYQDLPSQLSSKHKVVHRLRADGKSKPNYHEIRLRKDSRLHALLGRRRLKVNSYHHQAVKDLGSGFRVSAVSDDGSVEAMENGETLSVQFHPELEREAEPVFDAIFKDFLARAAARAGTPALKGRAWPEADALFRSDPRWLGGDGAYSVPLGGDRTLWLFGDSFVARSTSTSRKDAEFVRNTVALQRGLDPMKASMRFYWGSKDGRPDSFFSTGDGTWLWPGHGAMVRGKLLLFFMRIRATPEGGPFGFETFGSAACLVDNPSDEPSRWRLRWLDAPANDFGAILGSAGTLQDDEHLYAFSPQAKTHRNYLARWPLKAASKGELSGVEWWSSGGWRRHERLDGEPSAVMDQGQAEASVHLQAGRLLRIQTADVFDGRVAARWSAGRFPVGPWTAPETVFLPSESGGKDLLIYAAKAHPELTAPGGLAVTYATNTMDMDRLMDDMSVYYPRFVVLDTLVAAD